MSYARWGCDGSDVYVFATRDRDGIEVIECCSCSMQERSDETFVDMFGFEWPIFSPSFQAGSAKEMIDHLNEHANRNDHVPLETFERIKEDYEYEV